MVFFGQSESKTYIQLGGLRVVWKNIPQVWTSPCTLVLLSPCTQSWLGSSHSSPLNQNQYGVWNILRQWLLVSFPMNDWQKCTARRMLRLGHVYRQEVLTKRQVYFYNPQHSSTPPAKVDLTLFSSKCPRLNCWTAIFLYSRISLLPRPIPNQCGQCFIVAEASHFP